MTYKAFLRVLILVLLTKSIELKPEDVKPNASGGNDVKFKSFSASASVGANAVFGPDGLTGDLKGKGKFAINSGSKPGGFSGSSSPINNFGAFAESAASSVGTDYNRGGNSWAKAAVVSNNFVPNYYGGNMFGGNLGYITNGFGSYPNRINSIRNYPGLIDSGVRDIYNGGSNFNGNNDLVAGGHNGNPSGTNSVGVNNGAGDSYNRGSNSGGNNGLVGDSDGENPSGTSNGGGNTGSVPNGVDGGNNPGANNWLVGDGDGGNPSRANNLEVDNGTGGSNHGGSSPSGNVGLVVNGSGGDPSRTSTVGGKLKSKLDGNLNTKGGRPGSVKPEKEVNFKRVGKGNAKTKVKASAVTGGNYIYGGIGKR